MINIAPKPATAPAPGMNVLDGLVGLLADPVAAQAKLAELRAEGEAAQQAKEEARQAREDLAAAEAALKQGNERLAAAQAQLTADLDALVASRLELEQGHQSLTAEHVNVAQLEAAAEDRLRQNEATAAELEARKVALDELQDRATQDARAAAIARDEALDALVGLADWREAMAQTLPALKKLLAGRR